MIKRSLSVDPGPFPAGSPGGGQSPRSGPDCAGAGAYPMVDAIANKIVQKYTSSTCEQLWIKKSEHAPPSMEEQRAITILRNDPQMRAEFINRIAAPIANKMFDCGMVP